MAKNKIKYLIGICLSLGIGNILYLIFHQWIFLGVGLIGVLLFLIGGLAKE